VSLARGPLTKPSRRRRAFRSPEMPWPRARGGVKESTTRVIPSVDFVILRPTTVHENARGALECGGLTPPFPVGLYPLGTLRRRQAAALQGAFGTVVSRRTAAARRLS